MGMSVPTEQQLQDILLEWSYRLPKGFPTISHGRIGNQQEVNILNQILREQGFDPIDLTQQTVQAVEQSIVEGPVSLGSDPTDTKEALVCLLVDAQLSNSKTVILYNQLLDRKLDSTTRQRSKSALVKQLTTTVNKYGKYYGSDTIDKAPLFFDQTLSDVSKQTNELVTLNNAVSAATVITNQLGSKIKPGSVRRDKATFEAIRSRAVRLLESNYQIKNYLPDNWCPGDIYLLIDPSKVAEALQATSLNVGSKSLNSYFYGSLNKKGSFIAVSLKMQKAQAGKGTTFLKTVVVDGVSAKDKLGSDAETKALIKFRNTKRRLDKYYFSSDAWKKDPKALTKVRAGLAVLKLPGAPIKPTEIPLLLKYLAKNKAMIQQAVLKQNKKLSKSLDVVANFQQAYTRFVTQLRSKNISKIKGDALSFIKAIEQNNRKLSGGKLNLVTYNELLAQKAATYDLASTLIEKWTNKTKKVSPAFAEHLNKVKNPFVAITLFAIAQHGLNPNFYKVVGRDNATQGSVDEFPTNSQIDQNKSADNLVIKDSPGQAGFQVIYLLNINSHNYKTTLTFRFASGQIRVEVQRLEKVA